MKNTVNTKNNPLVQMLVIVSASVTCVGYGMHYAWTSPSVPLLIGDSTQNISMEDASYLVVFQGLAMAVSAPIFSIMLDKIGRKRAVLFTVLPQIVAWILIAYAHNIWLLFVAKFMVGISDASIYATIPIYVCEIAEPSVRHGWASLIIIAMYAGIFMVNVIGAQLNIKATALICLACSSLHLVTCCWIPESPYYLLMKDKPEDAKKALKLLRMRNDIEEEFFELKADVIRQQSESGTWKDLIYIGSNRKALCIASVLRLIQQLGGVTVFEVYAQYMFQEAGVSLSASLSAIVFTGVSLLATTVSLYTVHKYGRKPLLLYSSLGCGLSLMIQTVYFVIKSYTDVNVSELYWLPLTGMIAYVIFNSFGIAILPSLIAGEIFSTSIKGKGMLINNVIFAVCLLALPKIFQTLTENLGIYAPFCLFTFCCFAGAVYVYHYVIETKGKTLEQIQQELKGNKAVGNVMHNTK